MNTNDEKIQWHPAFDAALQIELGEETKYKADTETVDFIPAAELTITFVCYHYPRTMLQKLQRDRQITVENMESGIYYLMGDAIPMQLIIVPRLSKTNNYWLNNLRNDLKSGGEIRNFIEKYGKNKNSKLYQALADTIMRANWQELKEERKMCEALRELFADDLRESREEGIMEGRNVGKLEGKLEGVASKVIEIVIKKYKKGCSVKETADMLEEPQTLIKQIYDVIGQCAPDYNVETIYKILLDKTI